MVIPDIDRIDTNLNDLLSRFNQYAIAFSAQLKLNNGRLNVICGISDIERLYNLKFSNLEIYAVRVNRFGIIKFIRFFRSLINSKRLDIGVLIAGDPFRGLLVCKLIRLFCKVDAPLQVQFHGEIGVVGFGKSLPNRVRNGIFRFLIVGADSFRLVSDDQIVNATKVFKVPNPKIVVAPVPISLDFIDLDVKKPGKTIGFVGRLHKERGVDLWIEIIKAIKIKGFDIELKIIGDGPLRKYFVEEVRKIGVPYEFTGRLTQKELKNEWQNISVLLSTAPAESYGMAMREAVMQGCAVVSYTNSGSKDVAKQYPDSVKLFTDSDGGANLIIDSINSQIDVHEVERYRNEFTQLQKDNITKLVKSWI